MSIDSIFELRDSDRAHFLAALMHSLGCSYICLWLHSPQNYLQSKDGYYHEDLSNQQASSSYGSLASLLFNEYRLQTTFILENDLVPGLAFKQTCPCIVLNKFDLHRLASSEIQLQFYLEARIKTTIFMGCRSGEIELGMSTIPQINIEMELQKLFPEYFQPFNIPLSHEIPISLQEAQQLNQPSSFSSNPMESSKYPSFLFNTTAITHLTTTSHTSSLNYPHSHLTQQAFPTPESVEAAIVGALLTVISSSTSTSPSLPRVVQDQESNNLDQSRIRGELSAFREFNGAFRSSTQVRASSTGVHRQNMMEKTLAFYRGLNRRRMQEQLKQGMRRRPSIMQLQHVLKERKRRERLKEHFEALRSLLPPGTKMDKATTLTASKDCMSSLQHKISELSRRKQLLESQLSSLKDKTGGFSSNEMFRVQLTPVDTESSLDQERRMDLQLRMRADGVSFSDFINRLLGFLKGVRQVKLVSMEAQSLMATSSNEEQQPYSINGVTFRITIEESDWDQSAFLEAVRRVIADLAPGTHVP